MFKILLIFSSFLINIFSENRLQKELANLENVYQFYNKIKKEAEEEKESYEFKKISKEIKNEILEKGSNFFYKKKDLSYKERDEARSRLNEKAQESGLLYYTNLYNSIKNNCGSNLRRANDYIECIKNYKDKEINNQNFSEIELNERIKVLDDSIEYLQKLAPKEIDYYNKQQQESFNSELNNYNRWKEKNIRNRKQGIEIWQDDKETWKKSYGRYLIKTRPELFTDEAYREFYAMDVAKEEDPMIKKLEDTNKKINSEYISLENKKSKIQKSNVKEKMKSFLLMTTFGLIANYGIKTYLKYREYKNKGGKLSFYNWIRS